MAENLDSFPARTTKRRRYPWDLWTDGQIWKLTRGKDYEVRDEIMRVIVCAYGNRKGLKVNTRVDDGMVVLQFSPAPKKFRRFRRKV